MKISSFARWIVGCLMMCVTTLVAVPSVVNFSGTLRNPGGLINGVYPMRIGVYTQDDTLMWEETHPTANFSTGYFSVVLGSITPMSLTENELKQASYLKVTVNNDTLKLNFSSVWYAQMARTALNADTAGTANIALTALSVRWEDIVSKDSVVTSNFNNTVTARAFVGDGAGLTNLFADRIATQSVRDTQIAPSANIAFSKLNITKADIVGLGIPSENGGTTNATQLQQRSILDTAPSTGQVLKWNGSAWAPAADSDTDTDTNTTYNAGTGLSLSGTTFAIASSVVTQSYAGGIEAQRATFNGTVTANLFVGNFRGDGSALSGVLPSDSSVGFNQLMDGSVEESKLMDGVVVSGKIANGAIQGSHISPTSGVVTQNYSLPVTLNVATVTTLNARTVSINALRANTLAFGTTGLSIRIIAGTVTSTGNLTSQTGGVHTCQKSADGEYTIGLTEAYASIAPMISVVYTNTGVNDVAYARYTLQAGVPGNFISVYLVDQAGQPVNGDFSFSIIAF
jgi:hypothetical protein